MNDGLEALGHHEREVAGAIRIAPFVVVPGHDLDKIPAHDGVVLKVDNRGTRIAAEVGSDERVVVFAGDELRDRKSVV